MTISPTRQIVSLALAGAGAGAARVADRAIVEATKQCVSICAAVVDLAGHLITFRRMDGTALVPIDAAIGKARTAAFPGKPASASEQMINTGKPSMLSVPGAVPLAGGQPVRFEDVIVGAIGISGSTGDGGDAIANAVTAAFGRTSA